jgi:hypothetical protein
MGQMLFEPNQSWQLGAHSAPAQDLAPPGSFSAGENTILLHNTGQSAIVGQRAGWALQNAAPQTGTPAVIGQYEYIRSTGILTTSSYHLVVGSNGRLDKLQSDSTLTAADSGTAAPFTSGVYPPSFAAMNNLVFIANGVDPLHTFNGTDVWNAGLAAPAAPGLADGGAGSLPADTYSVKITFYDSATGLESSSSPETEIAVAASKRITVTWTAYAGEHPYTGTKVYIRQNSNQTEHFFVATVTAPTATYSINLTQDQLDALTLLVPDEEANDEPPTALIGVAAHVSRLFAHNGSRVYYSNLDQPEAFDIENSFTVNADDGQKITALHSAHELLLIFKRDSVWALYGEDPATWVPRMISPTVGCLNERSIVTVEGTTYWWSESGPMAWTGVGAVVNIGQGKIDADIAFEAALSTAASSPTPSEGYIGIVGTMDLVNQRILWAVPSINSTQNDLIFPYKYRFAQWEATRWTGMDASSLASIQDDTSTQRVYLGGYKGQIFAYGGVTNDGTPSGVLEGNVASATTTTLTIATGSLLTTGGGLTERYVYVHDGAGSWQVKRIGSNTGTVITLASGVTFSPVPNSSWTWSVGTIGFQLTLPWMSFSSPFIKKRLEYGYFWVGSSSDGGELTAELYRDYDTSEPVRSFTLPMTATGLIWDTGSWDEAVWGGGVPTTRHRKRLAKVCFTYRWVFRQFDPNVDAAIYKVDSRAESQTDRT